MRIFHKLSLMALPVAALAFTPVAQAQNASPRLFFEGDMVRGIPHTGPTGPGCVLNSQFKHKEEVVWRIRVLDGANGMNLGSKELKSVVVELPDGHKVPLRFSGHPNRGPKTDHFWAGSWMIPASYPTGTFAYKVVATEENGHEATWQPFKIHLSELTILPGDATPMKRK